MCVGESLADREGGTTNEVVDTQTVKALEGLTPEQVKMLSLLMNQFGLLERGVLQQLHKQMKPLVIFAQLLNEYMEQKFLKLYAFNMVDQLIHQILKS